MKSIEINGQSIGPGSPSFIIAEAGENPVGDLEVAKEMIRRSKLCGVDCIKFQHHIAAEEVVRYTDATKDIVVTLDSHDISLPLYDYLEQHTFTIEDHAALLNYCQEVGITYLCTPFSRKAAEELYEIGVSAFKIGSGELTDIPTLKVIASFGKPMMISTGMAEWAEIDETVEALRPINDQLVLMNCVSEYPAQHANVNLRVIQELQQRYDVLVGHSDHTLDNVSCLAAVALGAKVLEKHLIVDLEKPGPDLVVSIDPYRFYQLVRDVRRVEAALGGTRTVLAAEEPTRNWAHRSVVSLAPIPKGATIAAESVWTKRPGTGIAPKHLDEIIGRVARVDIPADHLISWEELEEEQV